MVYLIHPQKIMQCELVIRQCFSIAPPLAKTASSSIFIIYINSVPENIEKEERAEPLHARILQYILK